MDTPEVVRSHVKNLLDWHSAHADLERAVSNVPPAFRGQRPTSLPYSLWQLLEHIRLAQADILDYCRNADYTSPNWPDDFWPDEQAPPSREAWQTSIDAVRRDRQNLVQLVDETDIVQKIPHTEEHTYLRELLLAADHTAYHVGQMVLVRRLLGIWPP